MLEHFGSRIEAAVREEALNDFTGDFHALGDLIKEAFEEVGGRLGYSIEEGTAPNEIYEAIRKPLASVRLMIEKGEKPPVEEIVSDDPACVEIRRLNTFICDFAEAYLKSGEEAVWNRMYEKAREREPTEQIDPEVAPLEARILASLKSPVWSNYHHEIKYATTGLKMLGFHLAALGKGFQYCPDCGERIEGYSLTGVEHTYIRSRCTNGECLKSGIIQTDRYQTIFTEEEAPAERRVTVPERGTCPRCGVGRMLLRDDGQAHCPSCGYDTPA